MGKELILLGVIGLFFGVWIGVAAWAKRSGLSKTIGIGGGFLAASVGLAIVAATISLTDSPAPPAVVATTQPEPSDQTPPTINAKTAATRAERDLQLLETALKDLKTVVETHDRAGFRTYVTVPLMEASKRWDEVKHPWEFNNCKAALAHAHSFAMTMWQEYLSGTQVDGVWNRKSREMAANSLKESRQQCREAIKQASR